jgi:ABC-type multidrug transport system ATPase subunit
MTDGRSANLTSPRLRLVDVVVRRPDGEPSEPVDLELVSGVVLILVGDPDAVPTALLRTVAGLDRPLSGYVEIDGERRASGGATVGLVTREHHLVGSLTAVENVVVPLLLDRGPAGDGRAPEDQLARLGVPESSWHNLLEQLSGGQQQRVAVARALIGGPALLCLDDPTSELDQASADVVWREVDAARSAGACVVTTAVSVTEALTMAERFAPETETERGQPVAGAVIVET